MPTLPAGLALAGLALVGLALSAGPTLSADLDLSPGGAGAAREADAPVGRRAGGGEILVVECVNIRRLHDGFLTDYRTRFEFTRTSRSFQRFDNFGRGWVDAGPFGPVGLERGRILLVQTPRIQASIEVYSGDYYWIDSEFPERSLWGRCNHAGRVMPLF